MGSKEQLDAWRKSAEQFRAQEQERAKQELAQKEQSRRTQEPSPSAVPSLKQLEQERLTRDVANRRRILATNGGNEIIFVDNVMLRQIHEDWHGPDPGHHTDGGVYKHIGELSGGEVNLLVYKLDNQERAERWRKGYEEGEKRRIEFENSPLGSIIKAIEPIIKAIEPSRPPKDPWDNGLGH